MGCLALERVRVIVGELVSAWAEKDLERVGELIEALAKLLITRPTELGNNSDEPVTEEPIQAVEGCGSA